MLGVWNWVGCCAAPYYIRGLGVLKRGFGFDKLRKDGKANEPFKPALSFLESFSPMGKEGRASLG